MKVELRYQSGMNNAGKKRLDIHATEMSYDDIEELIVLLLKVKHSDIVFAKKRRKADDGDWQDFAF